MGTKVASVTLMGAAGAGGSISARVRRSLDARADWGYGWPPMKEAILSHVSLNDVPLDAWMMKGEMSLIDLGTPLGLLSLLLLLLLVLL